MQNGLETSPVDQAPGCQKSPLHRSRHQRTSCKKPKAVRREDPVKDTVATVPDAHNSVILSRNPRLHGLSNTSPVQARPHAPLHLDGARLKPP